MSFKLLYGLVILRQARRQLVRRAVTEWIAGQVTEALLWNEAPKHLIRDSDGAFGAAYSRRIRAMASAMISLLRAHPGKMKMSSG